MSGHVLGALAKDAKLRRIVWTTKNDAGGGAMRVGMFHLERYAGLQIKAAE